MKLLVFSIYDSAVKAYNQPIFLRSKGEAIRSFQQSCNDEKSNLHLFHSDYSLFYLGEFDDSNAQFSAPIAPERVISASECITDGSERPVSVSPKRAVM